MKTYVRWMQELRSEDLGDAGKRTALLCDLLKEEFPVPRGFVVLATAYDRFLEDNNLRRSLLREGDSSGRAAGQDAHPIDRFRSAVVEAKMDPSLEEEILKACDLLRDPGRRGSLSVSIDSAILPELPFEVCAQDSMERVVPVRDGSRLVAAVREAWASVWTPDLYARCGAAGLDPSTLRVALRIRRFVRPSVSGVLLTVNPAGGAGHEMVVTSRWGLGETAVSAALESDRFVLQRDPPVLLEQSVGNKERMLVFHEEGEGEMREAAVPEDRAEMPCLSWDRLEEIAEMGRAVEKITAAPQKIHWAIEEGDLFLLGCVPLPAGRRRKRRHVEDIVETGSSRAGGFEESSRQGGAGKPEPVERSAVGRFDAGEESSAGNGSGWNLSWREKARAEILSSLFRGGRCLSQQGGEIREREEFSHTHTGSRYWNESYYFNFSDPDHGIGGFSRIGMVPNQDLAIGILYLFLPDRGILMVTQTEPCRASRDVLSTGLLRYERILPLWGWRILFQGNMLYLEDPAELPSLLSASSHGGLEDRLSFRDVSVDIRFRGWSPCHNFKDVDPRFLAERFVSAGCRLKDLRAVAKVASEHYEQVGGWEGEIVLDGERLDVRGSGHRDHSWGERDWKAPRKWTWLTAQFGEALGFNLSRVVIRSLDLFNGYVCRDGKNFPLRRAWLKTEFEADGLTQRRVFLRLQDTSGWEAEIEGRPRSVVPLILQEDAHRTLVNEAFTEYRWDGKIGLGISEYLHQLPER